MTRTPDEKLAPTASTDLPTQLTPDGASVWLDDLDRTALLNGTLARLVRYHHVAG
jgi:hypothetical protein